MRMKMKILVYDVAAEDGGGLFVLKNFYEEVIKAVSYTHLTLPTKA